MNSNNQEVLRIVAHTPVRYAIHIKYKHKIQTLIYNLIFLVNYALMTISSGNFNLDSCFIILTVGGFVICPQSSNVISNSDIGVPSRRTSPAGARVTVLGLCRYYCVTLSRVATIYTNHSKKGRFEGTFWAGIYSGYEIT